MSLIEKVKLIFYRVAEKGLEIFLIGSEEAEIQSRIVEVSEQYLDELPIRMEMQQTVIELEPVKIADEDSQKIKAIALEGDWYHTPSLRASLKDDYEFLKKKLSQQIPDFDNGAFVNFRDLVGKVVSQDLKALKELKEVISDRYSVRDI